MRRPPNSDRIPIFPLEVVLLPGAMLPLHIFEPRYQLMIQRCIEKSLVFGVLFQRAAEVAQVGCTAAIAEIVKTFEDGTSDIVTVGQRIFAVKETFDDEPYTEASIRYLADEVASHSPGARQLSRRLWKLCVECHKLMRYSDPDEFNPETGDSLAYYVARILPLESGIRQELLEMRSESKRQARLAKHIENWMPKLARVQRTRAKAAGNGHGRHEYSKPEEP
jgi:ATP-dependent Lon protease